MHWASDAEGMLEISALSQHRLQVMLEAQSLRIYCSIALKCNLEDSIATISALSQHRLQVMLGGSIATYLIAASPSSVILKTQSLGPGLDLGSLWGASGVQLGSLGAAELPFVGWIAPWSGPDSSLEWAG